MKHAFLCALVTAICLLAPPTHAQLKWLDPLPHASKPPATTPKPPITPSRSRIDKPDYAGKNWGLPLELVINDNRAKVCQLRRGLNPTKVCAAIEAPLPPGTTVKLWNLPDGTTVLTYARTPGVHGVPDPDGKAAVRFQAAFIGAAHAVQARTGSSPTHNPVANVEVACDNEDCVEGGGNGPDGGGGGSGGPDGGSGGGGNDNGAGNNSGGNISGGENGSTAVVTVHGDPEPDIQTVTIVGRYEDNDTPELLPPLDPRDNLADLTNPCVINPILTVCVVGKRPPVMVDEPELPPGPRPIFPQWACNFTNVLCTRGQIRRDGDPNDPPPSPSWPKEPQFHQCMAGAQGKLDYCKTMRRFLSLEQMHECLDDVTAMINDCHVLYGPGQ